MTTASETQGSRLSSFSRHSDRCFDHTSDAEANFPGLFLHRERQSEDAGQRWQPDLRHLNGYLETPENGFYNFHVESDANAVVALTLNDKAIDLVQSGNVRSNKDAVELRAGTLYPFSLKVEKVKNTLTVRWETEGRGREIVPARYLYPETLSARLHATYVRFLKAVSLAEALKLTASETVHFGFPCRLFYR